MYINFIPSISTINLQAPHIQCPINESHQLANISFIPSQSRCCRLAGNDDTRDVEDGNLEVCKLESGDGVKGYIVEDELPLEEGVVRIG